MKFMIPFSYLKKILFNTTLVVILCVSFLSVGYPTAHAQAGATPGLFSEAVIPLPTAPAKDRSFVLRSRYVTVNIGLLSSFTNQASQAQPAAANAEVVLNLFPDVTEIGVLDRIESNGASGQTWIGTLKNVDQSYFCLLISDNVFIAHIASPHGIYEVSSASDGLYQVVQIDQSKLSEGSDTLQVTANQHSFRPLPETGTAADSSAQIDVMIVYTSAARAGEGSVAAMNARVDLAVAETNASYVNSAITPRINLVYKGEVSYTESGNMGTDLGRLQNPSDGFLDAVQTLRNTYKADLVQLIVETGGGCGIGYFMNQVASWFEAYAYSVVFRAGCMTGNYSSGHEFGHNQSADHDAYVSAGTTPYPYNHGYVNLASRWRTIMAYNDQCAAVSPNTNCLRLQYWSNPNKTYNGAVMGTVATAANALVLNNTAATVANFRASGTTVNSFDSAGVFRPANGLLYLKNANVSGVADVSINYGTGGDYPVAGDWNGDGTDTIGVYRNGTFYLRNSNTKGVAELVFAFGSVGDQPVVGDWNGDGVDTIGVYRNGTFMLRNNNSAGAPDMVFALGNPGDVGIAGDWNGDGLDTTGVFRPSNGVIFLKNVNSTGVADLPLNYGLAGDKPVIGDWNGDGVDTIGVYRNAKFYLRNSNTNGVAELIFALGNPGDMPISGNWDGSIP